MSASFSVVTPNFNMGRYLGETIESVLCNLGKDDEYFIVDGGSTDESVDVIRSYEKYLSGWISEPDRGYADALVKGFARARGDLLCWVNAGDLLLNGALELARKYLMENNADMIFGDDFYIDENSNIISYSRGYVHSLNNMMLFGGWTPLQDACFWRRSLYEHVGGIDVNLKFAADYDLFLRFSMNGSCRYVPALFSAFRRHDGQKSLSGADNYKIEREECRKRQLSGQSHLVREIAYWILVRLRARVMHKLWKYTPLKGVQVSQVLSRPRGAGWQSLKA